MAQTYSLDGKTLNQEQVDAGYAKATPDQRSALNQKLGLSYDVNTGKPSSYQPGTNVQGQVTEGTPVNSQSLMSSFTDARAIGEKPQEQISSPSQDAYNRPDQMQPQTKVADMLAEGGQVYQDYLKQGLSPDEARREIAKITSGTNVGTPQATTTPKPTENVATAQKTGVPEDVQVKQQKGLDMLNKIVAQSPGLLDNYDFLKKTVGYDSLDQNGKNLVDAFYQSKTKAIGTQDGIFGILAQGQQVQNQDILRTPAYQMAKARFDSVGKYKGASSDTLYNAFVNDDLASDGQAYKDLIMMNGGIETPEMLQAKAKAEKKKLIDGINRNGALSNGTATQKKDTLTSVTESVVADKGLDYATEFKNSIIDNPELKKLSEEVSKTSLQIKELEDQKDLTMKNIAKQYPGITTGAAMLLAAQQNEAIDSQLKSLYNKQSVASSNLKYNTEMAMKMFDFKVEQDKANRQQAAEDKRLQAQQEFQMQMDERNFAQQKAILSLQDRYQSSRDVMNYKQDLEKMGLTNAYGIQKDKLNFEQQKQLEAIKQKYADSKDVNDYAQQVGLLKYKYDLENSGSTPVSSSSTPVGRTTEVNVNGRGIEVDEVGAAGLASANDELNKAGIPVFVAGGMRDQIDTIAKMAKKNGIPFNASNPAETASKLRTAGHQVADPGKSLHENGMAIDVYSDKSMKSGVTKEQEAILNKNGWYSAGIPGDAGHFEYKGVQGGLQTLGQFMKDNQERGTGYSKDDVDAFNEKINRYIRTGDEKGMTLAYRSMLMKDKDFKQEFDNTKKFVTALDSVQKLVNDYEQAGKSTNALKSMAEKVARGLGITTDVALARMQTQMGFTLANYIRSISGTAASDTEVQRLMGNMAQIGNVKELNTAIISQARENGISGLKSMIDNRMYGMPEDLKPKVFGDIYKTESKNTYKTDQGEFTEDQINSEIQQALASGESIDNIKKWLKNNNIPFNE